ncbi:hypothetical protein TSAR_012722 [Trichomalopsis sarcophagae]|uniref:Uncharacterized protein n=1 Tax=Trichomalopsis sarcophagae TaxID=543379 RepID=A0A232FIP1_9HYME|nr:hypothetical protein TSAR_012722 [Trichomalopsis sarcophagae]
MFVMKSSKVLQYNYYSYTQKSCRGRSSDDLPLHYFKDVLVYVMKTMTDIYNDSLHSGVVFGCVQNLMRIDVNSLPQIVIDGTPIPFTKSVKDLGVHHVTWNSHILSICSRVHAVLNRLRFRTYYLSSSLKKQLVAALISPHLDYAYNVLCDFSGYLDLKLMRLFNTLVRFIFRLPRDARLSPYIAKLGWLPPDKRRRYFLAVTTYQILKTLKPSYLTPFLPPLSNDIR